MAWVLSVNVHILAIPVYERHTSEVIFDSCSKALDSICSSWRDIIIGVATDGERKMTGSVSGVVTRFQRVSNPGFIRIWCGAHQLDIVLQKVYASYGNEEFYTVLTSSISYLRRQQNLINDMRSKAPKISATRWESMSGCSSWFKLHRVPVQEYFELKRPSCAPPPKWWIMLMVIDAFSSPCTTTFKSIQGHQVTVGMQRTSLIRLQSDLLQDIGGRGPLTVEELQSVDESQWILSACRRFSVNIQIVKDFILDMGSFVCDKVHQIGSEVFSELAVDTAALFANAAAGVFKIVAERDANNDPSTCEIPPVIPQELVKVRARDFCAIVREQTKRLLVRWTRAEIDLIEQEHWHLLSSYDREPVLRSSLDALDAVASFHESWKVLHNRFTSLQKFCGGIACVFPGTSQVESE